MHVHTLQLQLIQTSKDLAGQKTSEILALANWQEELF